MNNIVELDSLVTVTGSIVAPTNVMPTKFISVLGWTECSRVGTVLGIVDGDSEGMVLGWTDGSRVGNLLGMSDGEIEGVSTDWGVGPVVVGTEVTFEGAVLGFIDGSSVGFWLKPLMVWKKQNFQIVGLSKFPNKMCYRLYCMEHRVDR